MSRIVVFLAVLFLSLPAWAQPENPAHLKPPAKKGDVVAQLRLADYYCRFEPEKAQGEETLAWLNKAAKSKDYMASAEALYQLGSFYLSLYPRDIYSDNAFYDPAQYSPARYCTGSKRSASNTGRAEAYLKQCVKKFLPQMLPMATDCMRALGHLYMQERAYAQAYTWYAMLIVPNIDMPARTGGRVFFKGPLLDAPYQQSFESVQGLNKHHHYLARLAARRLQPAQVARIDAEVRATYYKSDKNMQREWKRTYSYPINR